MDIRLRQRSKAEIVHYFSEKLTKANKENEALRSYATHKNCELRGCVSSAQAKELNLKCTCGLNNLLNPQTPTEGEA